MQKKVLKIIGVMLLFVVFSSTAAWAKLKPEEVARLGKDLTPMGAEKAGNAEGTIPAWEGGLTTSPDGWDRKNGYADPYADDKILFTITKDNMDQYADKLTEGHKALLRMYDTYKMNIYPSHRSAAFTQAVYDGTKRTAVTAELTEDGNGVTGAHCGIPFPIPKNGHEVLWNSILRYFVNFVDRQHNIAAVTQSGKYSMTKVIDYAYTPYWDDKAKDSLSNVLWYYKQNLLAPPRVAGGALLLLEIVNQEIENRKAWLYNPGQRRVRRAPEYAYDNPWNGSDGLMTVDSNLMFFGSPDHYDWKLVGKKELYVPYNPYRLNGKQLKYNDIIKPHHINQDFARYELHRTWVVEGTLKKGKRHIYKRRNIYIDEDSWFGVAADMYAGHDELWRFAEGFNSQAYDVPAVYYALETQYDLREGRYLLNFLDNEEPQFKFVWPKGKEAAFTVQALRRAGRR